MALPSGNRNALTYNIALEDTLCGGRKYHDSALKAKDQEIWGLRVRLLQRQRSTIV